MTTEIIEPNPLLVEYFLKSAELNNSIKIDLDKFENDGEWHYIQSNIENNILLLKRLDERGLLSNKIDICDCGIGFGTVMYDLYLQSTEFKDKDFTFTGIEKCDDYVNSFKDNLIDYWNGRLNLIHDDIMNVDYSNWNLIWFYTPFKVSQKLLPFFAKVISEVPVGSTIIGLDTFSIMEYGDNNLINSFNNLKQYDIDGMIVYHKPI